VRRQKAPIFQKLEEIINTRRKKNERECASIGTKLADLKKVGKRDRVRSSNEQRKKGGKGPGQGPAQTDRS